MIVLLLLMCFFLPACFPGSVAQLRTDSPETYQYKSARNYQDEYRFALDLFDKCLGSGLFMDLRIQPNLYTDKRFGEITIIQNNLGTKYYHLNMVIKEINESSSEVTTYGFGHWRDWGQVIESGKCPE